MSRSRRPRRSEPSRSEPSWQESSGHPPDRGGLAGDRTPGHRPRPRLALACRPVCAGAAVALAGCALAGCATAAHPGIAVDQLQSNVNFGLPPTPSAAPSTAAVVSSGGFTPQLPGAPVALPPVAQLPTFQFTAPPSFNYPSVPGVTGPAATTSACPAPAPGSSPALAASESSPRPPAAGYYLWQWLVPYSVPEPGGKTKVVIAHSLTDYRVTNPSKITTTTLPAGQGTSTSFTYDEVEPLDVTGGGSITYTFQVVNNAPGQQQVDADGETATTIVGVNDGVSITSETERNAKGQVTGSFTPSTPVTILPLPAVPGAKFQSTGTDPATGQSLTVDGQIQTTDRVAGCGIYAAGWRVVATEAVGRGANAPAEATDTYSVAPQYGGLVIADSTASELADAGYATQVGLITPSRTPVSAAGGAG